VKIAQQLVALGSAADAMEQAEARAIGADQRWDLEMTKWTFDDNSVLAIRAGDMLAIDADDAASIRAYGEWIGDDADEQAEVEMSKITVDDIRRLESEVGQFELCRKFATHVRKSLEPAYEGIELTSHGGLFRSDAAYAVDEALASVYRAAGYPVDHYYDLAVAIWDAKK